MKGEICISGELKGKAAGDFTQRARGHFQSEEHRARREVCCRTESSTSTDL